MKHTLKLLSALLITSTISSAQWVDTEGPYNSNVFKMENNGATVFTGGKTLGVSYTEDKGANWTHSFATLSNPEVRALHIAGNKIYAGTYYQGINVSTDSAKTWTLIGLENKYLKSIIKVGNKLFVGTEGVGLHTSTDEGTTWTQENNGIPAKAYIYDLIQDGTILYARCYGDGVYYSNDTGSTWQAINNGLANEYVTALTIHDGTLFASTYFGGVFKSVDNGANWTPANTGLGSNGVNAFASSGNTVFAGLGSGSGVYKTTDGGANWTDFNEGLSALSVNSMTLMDDELYIGSTAGAVHKRTLDNLVSNQTYDDKASFLYSIIHVDGKIQVKTENDENYSVQINSVLGNVVFINQFVGNTDINTSSFKKGIYLVSVIGNRSQKTRKIYIQ